MKKASKITDAERSEIDILHGKGYSAREVAKALGRSPNTIAAELKRNSYNNGRYETSRAKQKAYVRHKYARYQGKKIQEDDALRSFIILKLGAHWNPDEIAGFMKRHKLCRIQCLEADCTAGAYASKTAIYEWLRSAWGQRYCKLLYCKRYNRKPRKPNKTNRVMIPDRIGIKERPVTAQGRLETGHCEYDSVVSSKHSCSTYALAVISERSTRLVRAVLVPNLKPAPYAASIVNLTKDMAARTLTTDNGIENKRHALVTKKTGVCLSSSPIRTALGKKVVSKMPTKCCEDISLRAPTLLQ